MKILQIAYFYPPMGGAGVQRALKFSRYLGESGIVPVVLAGADPHYVHDDSLGAEVPPGVAVHRVAHTPWLGALAARRRAAGAASRPPAQASVRRPALRVPPLVRDRLLAAWQALQWPDEMAGWARRAAPLARRLIADSRAGGDPVRLVFSSSPPVSAHLLGHDVAREFDLPWVADLRDLWTDNPGYAAPAWRAALDRRRERALLAAADGIVTVTQTWAELLSRRCGGRTPVAFIPNGFDESDFAVAAPHRQPDGLFRLTHAGTFYGPRDPAALLGGVARLLDADPAAAARLRLRLVGNVGARFEPALAAFAARHPQVVERRPYVPHAEALAEMRAADALLMVVGGAGHAAGAGWLPGKLFEYLRAGPPVLALGPPAGEAAAIVRGCGAGVTLDESDTAGIARVLGDLLAGRFERPVPQRPIDGFERRALTRQLAAFLREVAARG